MLYLLIRHDGFDGYAFVEGNQTLKHKKAIIKKDSAKGQNEIYYI
jgi:hypothetical protein